ncbi:MAG: DMT family transporter [Rhodospirillales bacterium]
MSLRGLGDAIRRRLVAPVEGALWMVFAAAAFAGMAGVVRHVSGDLHPFEIVFFRNLFGLVFMLPWLAKSGLGVLKTRRLGLYTVRAVLNVIAMLAAFSALAMMPIADAMALSFTAPLFGTVLAALVLAEGVRLRRWAATGIGFLGAMLILRPGFGEMNPAALLALVGAAAVAATGTVIKMLSGTEPVNAIVAYMVIFLTPMSLVPALYVWTAPDLESLLWLAILGGLGTLAHIGVTRAFKAADASLVLPFDFVRLPFAALIGYAAFDERPDAWTWTAAAVIAGATLYVAGSEAMAAAAASSDRPQSRKGMSAP